MTLKAALVKRNENTIPAICEWHALPLRRSGIHLAFVTYPRSEMLHICCFRGGAILSKGPDFSV